MPSKTAFCDPETDETAISLMWAADEKHEWKQFSATMRYLPIHAWQYYEFGKADHVATFTR